LTNQYNPTKGGGAANVGEWVQAVGVIIPRKGEKYAGYRYGLSSDMTVQAAVDMIRATPQSKRKDFAAQLRRHNPANPWPWSRPDARRTTPARGGIAYHSGKRKVGTEAAQERAEAKREAAQDRAEAKREAARQKSEKRAEAKGPVYTSIPDEKTIQEGFKRGLTLNEILRGNPALRKNLVFSAQKLKEHEYDVYYKIPGYEWARAGVFEARSGEGAIAMFKETRWLPEKGVLYSAKRTNPAKFDRCVKAVQAKGGAANAYAVCTAAGTRNPGKATAARKAYERAAGIWEKALSESREEFPATPTGARLAQKRIERERRAYAAKEKALARYQATAKDVPSWFGGIMPNPASAAAEVFEEFHGYAPSEVITVTKHVHHHEHLAAAGKLLRLDVWGVDGKGHKISGFKGAFLAFNESKNQLFVEGGDQSIDLADFGIRSPHEMETLGRVTDIGYETNKTHLGDEGGQALYIHKFRSTNKDGRHVIVRIAREPDLIYDVRNEQLLFSGGSYEILREGIDK